MRDNSVEIGELVAALPEIYQPIFGYPEYSNAASRQCDDRLEYILVAYDALCAEIGRPLRVLDLGCAQGFFSLNLAARGATVHGVDYLDKNVSVCKALAAEHPDKALSFEVGRIEDVIGTLRAGNYDLMLGLSVFHHIIHEHGVDFVQGLFTAASRVIDTFIVEFALSSEPLYWAESQPDNPRTLLSAMPFVHELARHETHLAAIARPLLFASRRHWFVDASLQTFNHWTDTSHGLAGKTHQGTRRYFFSDDCMVKLFSLQGPRGEFNVEEIMQEARVLCEIPDGIVAPEVISVGKNEHEAWLVRTILPGELLLERLARHERVDALGILKQVLKQASLLEEHGLFHQDIRTWNILISDEGKATLIDYGSLSEQPVDCVWPTNLFLSILVLVRELTSESTPAPLPLRVISVSPFNLPEPFNRWAVRFWQVPPSQWSYELMLRLLDEVDLDVQLPEPTADHIWARAVENALQGLADHGRRLETQQRSVEKLSSLRLDEVAGRLDAEHDEVYRLSYEVQQLKESMAILTDQLEALRPEPKLKRSSVDKLQDRIKRAARDPADAAKALLRRAALQVAPMMMKHPALVRRVVALSRRYPPVHAHLRQFAISRGLIHGFTAHAAAVPVREYERDWLFMKDFNVDEAAELDAMSPWQRQIFMELKKAQRERLREGEQ